MDTLSLPAITVVNAVDATGWQPVHTSQVSRNEIRGDISLTMPALRFNSTAICIVVTMGISVLAGPSIALANNDWDCHQIQDSRSGKTGTWRCRAGTEEAKKTTVPEPATQANVAKIPQASAQSPAATAATLDHTQAPVAELNASDLAQQDWQTIDDSSSHCEQSIQARVCGGSYINPLAQAPTTNYDDEPIKASAGQSSMENNTVIFQGKVLITRGPLSLQAEQASVSRDTEIVTLTGNVAIRSPDVAFGGNRATVDLTNKSSLIEDANYVVHDKHIRGTATSINSDEHQRITIKQGSYTHCAPDSSLWELRASKIKLDHQHGQGRATHARVNIKGVPVAYLPYAAFPIGDQRQSGFLFPSLSSGDDGFDIALPYYFNLASNVDATLAPRYNEDRGYITEAELRWLNRFDQWSLSGAYIDEDKLYIEEIDANDSGERWIVNVDERGQFADRFVTLIDYTRASDDRYLRDLNSTSLSISRSSHLNQRFRIEYLDDLFSAGVNIQQYQTIDSASTQPYEQRPEVWLLYASPEKNFRPAADFTMRYTDFVHEELIEGQRSFGELNLGLPMRWGALRVKPKIGVQHLAYSLDKNSDMPVGGDSNPELTVPQASFDTSLRFEKTNRQSGSSSWQTLEPGLFYLYRESKDQQILPLFDTDELTFDSRQLTRSSRLSGYDRVEGANQLALRISHKSFTPQGLLRSKSTIGQIFYFDRPDKLSNEAVRLSEAEPNSATAIVAENSVRWNRHWRSHLSTLWDTEDDLLNEGSASVHYWNQAIFNAGYHFRRKNGLVSVLQNDIEIANASFLAPLSARWGVFGRFQYDISREQKSDIMGGLEYNNCCVRLRLAYREGLVYRQDPADDEIDKGIHLQIQLKGLFGVGNGIENVMEESIFGYGATAKNYLETPTLNENRNNRHTSF